MIRSILGTIALLALLPAAVMFAVLAGLFAYVDHANGYHYGQPWGFIVLAVVLTFLLGLCCAADDIRERVHRDRLYQQRYL